MAAKTIHQQPVTLTEVNSVSYLPMGNTVDFSYAYTPVDETGAPIGEKRAMSGSKTGPAAQEIRDWLTQKVLPEINATEGTA